MKILILNYEFPPLWWWAANATFYLLKEFAQNKDLQITLVTSSTWDYREEQFADNIKIYYLDIGKEWWNIHHQTNKNLLTYSAKSYFFTQKLLKQEKYDLIHAFFGIPCWYIAMQMQKKFKIPYIVSLRWSDVPFYSKKYEKLDKLFFQRLSRKIWRNAHEVIANSDWLRDLAYETSRENEIKVIYNWINLQEFDLKLKKDPAKFQVLYVGRLIERKWVDFLVKGFEMFAKDKNNVQLNMVWTGNMAEELNHYIQQNWLQDKIFLVWNKPHDQLAQIYNQNDIYILPSKNEWMSNTLLEATASGLPVMISNTWGTFELFDDNGWLLDEISSHEIAHKLNLAYSIWQQWALEKVSKNNYNIVKDLSWQNIAKQYLQIYQKTCAE